MPIPSPREGEKEKEFISRCMSALGDEDRPNEQKLAICYSKWREKGKKASQEQLRAVDVRRILSVPVRTDASHPGRVVSYAAIWGDEDHKDLYDTWFSKDTDFCLDWYDRRPWIYDHGFNPFVRAAKIGEWKDIGLDDHGLFFLGELDQHFRYTDEIEFLMELGYLFPSSGTISHLMHIADDGWIERWPVAELSSTAAPAEWRIPAQISATSRRRAAIALRTLLGGLTMPNVASALFPGANIAEIPSSEVRSDELDDDTAVVVQETEELVDTETEGEVEETEPEEPVVPSAPGEPEPGPAQQDLYQQAIMSVDESLRGLHQLVQELATRVAELEDRGREPVASRVAHLVDDPTWVRSLWSASRSGRALRNSDAGEDGDDEPMDLSAPMLQRLGTIGAEPVDPSNILGSILESQRRS